MDATQPISVTAVAESAAESYHAVADDDTLSPRVPLPSSLLVDLYDEPDEGPEFAEWGE